MACIEAQDYAMDGDEKLTEKQLKTAQSASKKVQKYVEDIHQEHELAKDYAKITLEAIVDQNHKEIIDAKKEELKAGKDVLREQLKADSEVLKEIRDELKDELKGEDIKEYEAEEIEAELLAREAQYREEAEEAKEELRAWEDEIKEEGKHLHVLDQYRLAMEYADTLQGTYCYTEVVHASPLYHACILTLIF